MERACTVLGVDPGTAVTGYGVVVRRSDGMLGLRECGVLRTSPSRTLAERLRDLFSGMQELVERFQPGAVAVEDVFQGKNVRSALTLGHTRGAILLAAALVEVPVAEYTPREVKKAVVGRGDATKDQVAFMVQKHLRLKAPPEPADAADGVALALCHWLMEGAILP